KVREKVVHPKTDAEIVKKGRKVRAEQIQELQAAGVKWVPVETSEVEGACAVADVVDPATGEVLLESAAPLTPETLDILAQKKIATVELVFPEHSDVGTILLETLQKDSVKGQSEAM